MIKKLQSNKGATFIIALIYFLICMMVGASMITAAAADRGRIYASIEEQRTYFLVSSVATTFRDKLMNLQYRDGFDYYNGGTGNKADYENAVNNYSERLDKDAEGKIIAPIPNQRFSEGNNINMPEDGINTSAMSDYVDDRGAEYDDFKNVYYSVARFARDIFYSKNDLMSDARSNYGYNINIISHSFEATTKLEDSTVPIIVKFSMIKDGSEYAKLDTYDILIEFKNDTTGTDDKEYCVSLLLKATKGVDTTEEQIINYKNLENVTNNGVTQPALVPKTIQIDTIPLTLQWDNPEIIMGTLEN